MTKLIGLTVVSGCRVGETTGLTLDDIVKFEQQSMASKPYRYLILGDEKELDMDALEKIGPIRRLTLEEIFGY